MRPMSTVFESGKSGAYSQRINESVQIIEDEDENIEAVEEDEDEHLRELTPEMISSLYPSRSRKTSVFENDLTTPSFRRIGYQKQKEDIYEGLMRRQIAEGDTSEPKRRITDIVTQETPDGDARQLKGRKTDNVAQQTSKGGSIELDGRQREMVAHRLSKEVNTEVIDRSTDNVTKVSNHAFITETFPKTEKSMQWIGNENTRNKESPQKPSTLTESTSKKITVTDGDNVDNFVLSGASVQSDLKAQTSQGYNVNINLRNVSKLAKEDSTITQSDNNPSSSRTSSDHKSTQPESRNPQESEGRGHSKEQIPESITPVTEHRDKRKNNVIRGTIDPSDVIKTGETDSLTRREYQKVKRVVFLNRHPNATRTIDFHDCPNRCVIINSTKDADLIALNAGQMNQVKRLPKRRPGQIWLMYSREAAAFGRFRFLLRNDLKGVVNWTASIYSDSTFPMVHGQLERGDLPDKNFDAIYDHKLADVAWFVSHCVTSSQREDYVKRMQPYIDVHIFGACGNMTCGEKGYHMGGHLQFCLDMLSSKYKFYLSFENALCENYMTEKFFNLFKAQVDIIPVVRTGANYKHRFPSDMFIDTNDFNSPQKLAKFLRQLSKDKARYVHMLKNKSRYKTVKTPSLLCRICQALHDGLPVQVLEDPYQFWGNVTARCRKPRDF